MIIDVDAVYESGVLRLKEPVDIPENSEVHVRIQGPSKSRTPLGERLREIRAQIIGAGVSPLDWDGVENEVARRRGGWREDR